LREEAVFAAVDMLAARGSVKSLQCPRRFAVRRAVRQGTAADLGQARLDRRNGFITLEPPRPRNQAGEKRHEFSLLIKEAGFYTLNGEVLGIGKNISLYIKAEDSKATPNTGFSAQLPLVFRNHSAGDFIYKGGHKRRFSDILNSAGRSRYAGIITACDVQGPAAFIAYSAEGATSTANAKGGDLTVISRDETQGGIRCYLFFELSLKHEVIDV